MTPCCFALTSASSTTPGVVSDSAAKISAGVQPADPLAEDLVPVEIAGLQLRGGGVAAVRASDGAAEAEPSLGEVQAVAHRAPDAVVVNPFHVRQVDTALEHEVFEQPADLVVREGADQRGAHPEASS